MSPSNHDPETSSTRATRPTTRGLGAAEVSRGLILVMVVLLGIAAVILTASAGGPHSAFEALLAVVGTITDSLPSVVLVAAGVGLGRLARPLFRHAADPFALQVAVGTSVVLTLTHALGVSGILGSGIGRAIALLPCVAGLVIGGHQFSAHLNAARSIHAETREVGLQRWRVLAWLAVLPAFGVLVAAACNPPGWLWATEFGGFDALGYHLQLPREWLAAGRVLPVDHSVYSYLPGYVESAFAFLGWLKGLGGPSTSPGPDPSWLMSCQTLHATLTLVAAWLTGRAAAAMVRRTSHQQGNTSEPPARPTDTTDHAHPRTLFASTIATTLTLATPWIAVVGSLAYNEMPMVALFAGAMLAALDPGLRPAHRGLIIGWLVGIACGVKPTALLFAGLPVAAVLLFNTPRSHWTMIFAAATATGLAALAPWLARNAIACGNPVFPYASSIFGPSHWTPEQFARFASGHHFDGSPIDHLRLLLFAAPHEPGATSSQRGMMHTQWGLLFPLTATAALVALVRPSRLSAAISLALVLQIAAWLFTTHLQSRFLIPLAVPAAMLVAWAADDLARRGARAKLLTSALLLIAFIAQSSLTLWIFSREQREKPNALLVPGPGILSGQPWAEQLDSLTPEQLRTTLANASPEVWINLSLPRDAVVYLLGDSTPLYIDRPVVYHTTWDTSPLGAAIRADPTNPSPRTDLLASRGVSYVLFNASEVRRLQRSGWYDPSVTPERAAEWLQTAAERVMDWPEQSRTLYRLIPSLRPGAAR